MHTPKNGNYIQTHMHALTHTPTEDRAVLEPQGASLCECLSSQPLEEGRKSPNELSLISANQEDYKECTVYKEHRATLTSYCGV